MHVFIVVVAVVVFLSQWIKREDSKQSATFMNTSTFSLTADADGMVATDCVKSERSPCSTLDVIRK